MAARLCSRLTERKAMEALLSAEAGAHMTHLPACMHASCDHKTEPQAGLLSVQVALHGASHPEYLD